MCTPAFTFRSILYWYPLVIILMLDHFGMWNTVCICRHKNSNKAASLYFINQCGWGWQWDNIEKIISNLEIPGPTHRGHQMLFFSTMPLDVNQLIVWRVLVKGTTQFLWKNVACFAFPPCFQSNVLIGIVLGLEAYLAPQNLRQSALYTFQLRAS